MLKREERTFVSDVAVEIKCDCCKKSLFKGKNDDDIIPYANLSINFTYKSDIAEGSMDGSIKGERTDLCETCYTKILSKLREMGAKVPSYYYDTTHDLLGDAFDLDEN